MEVTYTKKLLTKELGKDTHITKRLRGGMMNISYIVEDHFKDKFILYLPNGKSNKLIDRNNEKYTQAIAYKLGITSKNVYFDTRKGIKINEYIEGKSLNNVKTAIDYQKIADILHQLHDSKQLALNDYHPINRLENYENKALTFAKESNDYRYLRDFFSSRMNELERIEKVLCHNDAQRSNFIKTDDDKYYIIDFEFCANNDPIYDIATFANNSLRDGEKLLMAYFNNKPKKKEIKRFYLWRVFISLQWHEVAIIKHYQNEGALSKINYLDVAAHFLENAKLAKQKYLKIK